MLLFKNKLIAERSRRGGDGGDVEEGAQATPATADSARLQRAALSSLSKQEKLLLLELQRTRQNIVSELNRLDPAISSDSWTEVQSTIATYQSKITRLAAEETVDGMHGRVPLISSKSTPDFPPMALNSSSVASSVTLGTSLSPSKYQSVTIEKRAAAVRAAAQIPVHRIRTGLDMLPVLASTGESALEVGLRKQGQLRLPMFKLPSIDQSKMANLLENEGMALTAIALASAQQQYNPEGGGGVSRRATDAPIVLRSEKNFRQKRSPTLLAFVEALYSEIRALSPLEQRYIRDHFSLVDWNVGAVEDELERRVRGGVVHDTEANGDISVFLKCRAPAWDLQSGAFSRPTSPGGLSCDGVGSLDGLGSVSVVTASTFTPKGGQRGAGLKSRAGSVKSHATGTISRKSTASKHSPGPSALTASETLRNELLESLRSMQRSTDLVKEGMAQVQALCLANNPRARAKIVALAAERLYDALSKLTARDMQRGFRAWALVVSIQRRQQCTAQLVFFLGLRNLARVLGATAHHCLDRRLVRWVNFARKETARVVRARQQEASVIMQRYLRGCMARDRARKLREGKKFKELYAAVILIQSQIRGRVVKWRYQKYVVARNRDRAARKIQRVQRGHRGRRRVRWLRLQRNRGKAATMIQSLARGRQGRLRVRGIHKDLHRKKCAIRIQALARGYIARRYTQQILHKIRLERAVRRVQKVWRGAIARKNIGRKRKEILEYKEARCKAVTDVQRVFRGYRSRMTSRIRQIEQERKKRKINNAAIAIQTMCRGFIARYTVRKRRRDRKQKALDDARAWVETYSEDAEANFYFNAVANETLWEPPSSGYTKLDGALVLYTGEVVDDPDLLEAEEEERKRQLGQVCSECSDRVAIKLCDQCGDTFCTPCYRSCHTAGARKLHTHTALGPLDCSECEIVLAERWCVTCDEAFCDECWRKMHARGKRRFHPFSDVSARGKIDDRVYTMDGTEVSAYSAAQVQDSWEHAVNEERLQDAQTYLDAQHAAAEAAMANWAEYADEQGYPFWYNQVSGESTYDRPW